MSSGQRDGPGELWVCATPIGNLDDITLRVLQALRKADLIAAEDTRHTRRLLDRHGIEARLVSYHEHNRFQRGRELVQRMLQGETVALVSDAGTPSISDPGLDLVRLAIEAGIPVTHLPGPSAVVTALVLSGFPTAPFYFGGFLARKASQRRRELLAAGALGATLVYFESPHRLLKALEDLRATLGERPLAVCRELTKIHEEVFRGSAAQALAHFGAAAPRGEIVLVIGPPSRQSKDRERDGQEGDGEERDGQESDDREGDGQGTESKQPDK